MSERNSLILEIPALNTEDNETIVRYPEEERPVYFAERNIYITMVDGKAEETEVRTAGQPAQKLAYNALVNKHGQPRRKSMTVLTNQVGADYESLDAIWILDGLVVELQGIRMRPTLGFIRFRTANRIEQLNKGEEERDSRRRDM